MTHVVATWRQQSFAWYTDAGGEGTNQIGSTNGNPSTLDAEGTQYRLRYLIQEYAGSTVAETPAFTLYYRVDPAGGTTFGSWAIADSDDTYFTAVASANVTDGGTTTQQIGAGTFNDGEFCYVDAGGATTNAMAATAGNDEYECEWVIAFATAAGGATFEFQVAISAANDLNDYVNTTQVVPIPPAQTITGAAFSDPDTFYLGTLGVGPVYFTGAEVGNVNDTTLVITTNVTLDASSTITASDFTLTGNTISSGTISGGDIHLTLGTAVVNSDDYSGDLSYTKTTSSIVNNGGSDQLSNFLNQDVTNNVDPFAPYYSPSSDVPVLILDFHNEVYAIDTGSGLVADTLSNIVTGATRVQGSDGRWRCRSDTTSGDTPTVNITNVAQPRAYVVWWQSDLDGTASALGFERPIGMDDGTTSERISLWFDDNNPSVTRHNIASGGDTSNPSAGYAPNTYPAQIASTWSVGASLNKASINGQTITTGTKNTSIPSGLTTLRIGHQLNGSDQIDGGVERIVLYSSVISDADLVTLSTTTINGAEFTDGDTFPLGTVTQSGTTISTSLDSALQKSFSISTDLEASLQKQLTISTAIDAVLQKEFSISTAVDAALQKALSISSNLDAALQKEFVVSSDIDATLSKAFSVSTSLDSALEKTFSVSSNVDAALQDSFSVSTSLDSVLQKEFSVSTSVDAALSKAFSVSTSLDSVLKKTLTVSTALDAHLIAPGTNTILTVLDAALQDSFSVNTSLDSALEKTFSTSTSFDAALEKTLSVSTSIDSALQDSFSVSTSIDSSLSKEFSVDTAIDAVLQKEFSVSTSLEATLKKNLSISTALQAHLIQVGTNTVATAIDAALQDSFSVSTSLDSAIEKTFTASTSLDSAIEKTFTTSTSFESALQKAFSISVSLDSVLKKTLTTTTAIDAYLIQVGTNTVATALDAALEKTFTVSTATDAVLQKEISVSTSLDFRALAQDVTLTTSLDARLIGLDAATARSAEPNNAKNTITVSGSLNQIDITGTPNKIDITATPNKVT